MLLADTVAVVHGAAVVLMLTGAVIALWRPRVLWMHLPVSLAILAVNRAGQPCPLTELELWLIAKAGGTVYEGGYLGHYVFALALHGGAGRITKMKLETYHQLGNRTLLSAK